MINQMFGRPALAALSRRVAHERRAEVIKFFLRMLIAAFVIVFLHAVIERIDRRGETRTIPAEQTVSTSHWRN